MNSQQGWWRPTGAFARALVALFGFNAVIQAAMITEGTPRVYDGYASAIHAAMNGRQRLAEQRIDNLSQSSGAALLQIAGFLAVALIVVIVIWQWRSVMNAQALQRTGARISSGWVIAGWLVPVANLFVPYLSLQDLARNTDAQAEPGDGWRSLPGSPLVTTFWLTYIIGTTTPLVVAAVVIASSANAADTDAYTIVGHLTMIAASVMGVFVVRQITTNQAEQKEHTAVAESRPVWAATAAVGSADGRGWHRDPLGRFDHRYWDGAIWTDWVSTEGQMTIDPEPVPGYGPSGGGDPST